MCKKRKKPVRLQKKEENKYIVYLKWLRKQPEFWLIVAFIIAFIILTIFAMKEAESYFVYNRGGLL